MFQIREEVYDKLDPIIYRLSARSEWTGLKQPALELNEYMRLVTYPSKLVAEVSYDRNKSQSKGPFNLEEVVEKASNTGASDLYISNLTFAMQPGNDSSRIYAHFKNISAREPTMVAMIEKLRRRYLKKHGIADSHTDRAKHRMLAFEGAETFSGNPLDRAETDTLAFVQKLKALTFRQVGEMAQEISTSQSFRETSFNLTGTVWKERLEEVERNHV